jgi:fatty acid CoA ligase FadD32
VDGLSESGIAGSVRELAAGSGDRAAFTFVDYAADLGGRRTSLTWAQVHRGARAVAAGLLRRVPPGSRAAILAPQGLEYVLALLGAFYARVTAVPLFMPDLPGHEGRLTGVLTDADPACVLTTRAAAGQVRGFLAGRTAWHGELLAVSLDACADPGTPPGPEVAPDPGEVAYLQYTSGSTRAPAGVKITHGCLAANAAQIAAGLGVQRGRATAVGWLPLFHDMGLLMTVIMPIAADARSVFMDPAAFLMRPSRWLRLVSEETGVYTAGPNFAYDYCAAKISESDKATLDLSGVRVFLNGAEPVRPETLRAFRDAFGRHGLAPRALTPGYGLAEATVYVASSPPDVEPCIVAFDRQALQRGAVIVSAASEAIELASCGKPVGQHVAIVGPESGTARPPGQVGEIWVNGPNVAPGYVTGGPGVFGAVLADPPHGMPREGWLRTGDLGVLHDGELFVTGRLRDLIIVDGRNHYPQDVEMTTQRAHTVVRRDRAAAFAIDSERGERVVIVAERARQVSPDRVDMGEVTRAVRSAVSARHGIRLHDFLLVEPGAVPRTSSGKIARSACRDKYLAGAFTQEAS